MADRDAPLIITCRCAADRTPAEVKAALLAAWRCIRKEMEQADRDLRPPVG